MCLAATHCEGLSQPRAAVRWEAIPRDLLMAKGVWEQRTTMRSPDTVPPCLLGAAGLTVGQGGFSKVPLRHQLGAVRSLPDARVQSSPEVDSCGGAVFLAASGSQVGGRRGSPFAITSRDPLGEFFFFPAPGECRGPDSHKETLPPGFTSAPRLVSHLGLLCQEARQRGTASPPSRVTTLARGEDRASVLRGAARTKSGTQEALSLTCWGKGPSQT